MKKKMFTLALVALLLPMSMMAQAYKSSRYYNKNTGRLEYSNRSIMYQPGQNYYGLRLGPAFSKVNSDDKKLDGGNWQTGLNLGAVAGFSLSDSFPLFLEGGAFYTEKGGKTNYKGKKMTYNLNYLEVPVAVKYAIQMDDEHVSIQPFMGVYVACGISGKMKNYDDREARSSFSDDYFQSFDGGLRMGCGFAYDMFYVELAYDLGLTNICHDEFDASHNHSLQLNVGVNF